jgi:hypothetical protein
MPYGSFNEEAIEVWDFVRCMRPDGTFYASPTGNCKKGTPAPKVSTPKANPGKVKKGSEEKVCVVKNGKKDCEKNWAELVVAAVIKNKELANKEEIMMASLAQNNSGYRRDLDLRDPLVVESYVSNLKKELSNLDLDPKEVYILGKNQRINSEIEELQKGLDLKSKKADVMVKTKSGEFVGISVKSGSQDTLTNYAIEKILPKESRQVLERVRKKMIEDAGLPLELDKSRRAEYNSLFKGKNPYHEKLVEDVMKNKKEVLEGWSSGLFADTPFKMYSFDGEKLRPNSKEAMEGASLDLKPIPNPSKNPKGAAKTFFLVTVNGTPEYIWDVRWKGNVMHSPQIQTHRIH